MRFYPKLPQYAALAALLLTNILAWADTETTSETPQASQTVVASQEAQARIKNSLAVLLPSVEPDSISQTSIAGLYQVVFGPRLVYITDDGRYLFQGQLIDLETRENLTEPQLAAAKASAIEAVGEQNMVIFEPENTQFTVTVFTDIDCGYCRKLHSEMDKYLANGIRIRYLFYPRAGEESESYVKAVSTWCADDRRQAMTEAKKGNDVPKKTCEHPVRRHMELGNNMGIRGTPALVLDDGEMIPGYVPPDKLQKVLALRALEAKSE